MVNKIFNTRTRFYKIWLGIRARVAKRNYKKVKISEDWLDFDSFYKDMFQSYCEHVAKYGEKNTSINRIDNNGNYWKENCEWATMEVQGNNRKNNRFITYNGETLSLSKWSRKIGVSRQALFNRIENGWPLEKALKISISPKTKLEELIKDVEYAKFGTKNRVELLQRLKDML